MKLGGRRERNKKSIPRQLADVDHPHLLLQVRGNVGPAAEYFFPMPLRPAQGARLHESSIGERMELSRREAGGAWRRLILSGILTLVAAACGGEKELLLPEEAEATSVYGHPAQIRGNILEVVVEVPEDRLQGGSLWARSTPYYYLFTVATRDLFTRYPDLAAVRVVTREADGSEIARATLAQSDLNVVTWKHLIAYASIAQTEGTEKPQHVSRLVREAEDVVSEYTYNSKYVRYR